MQALILVGRRGHAASAADLDRPQAGRPARRPAVHRLHARMAARPRRRRRRDVLRLPGHGRAQRARRRLGLRRSGCATSRSPSRAAPAARSSSPRTLLDERFLMLNGDVLTDIDLTAQIAQHERTGARATLALVPVEDPSAYGLVRLDDDARVTRVPREAEPPTRSTRTSSPPARTCSSASARPASRPDAARLDRARGLPEARRQRPVRLHRRRRTGSTSARPSATCRGRTTSSRATCATAVARAPGDAASSRWPTDAVVDGRVVAARASSSAACASPPARTSASLVVLGRGVRSGAGATVERAVVLRAPRSAPTACCATASSAPASRIGDAHARRERRRARRGRHVGADNVVTRGRGVFPGVELPDGAIKF